MENTAATHKGLTLVASNPKTCQFQDCGQNYKCGNSATHQTRHGFVCQQHLGFFLRTNETPRAL